MQAQRPLTREEAKLLTRHRLLQAARELLAGQGPEGLTTGRVAQRADVAQATFYVHFRGLDELLAEVATGIVGQVQQALTRQRLRFGASATLWPEVRESYRLALVAIDENAPLLRRLLAESLHGQGVLGECGRALQASLARQLYEDLRRQPLTAALGDRELQLGADAVVGLTVHTGLGLAEGRLPDREAALDLLCQVTLALLSGPRPA